jgi:ribosomal protein S18 acetylase RimI-like enzyme
VTLDRSFEQCLETLFDNDKERFCIYVDSEQVGVLIIDMNGMFKGYIQALCIKPEWRGKGIGKRTLKFAEDMIFERTPNVFICYSDFNGKAGELYRSLGYVELGVLDEYLIPGHCEILLRKTICSIAEHGARTKKRLEKWIGE